jgi:hypothetical protein
MLTCQKDGLRRTEKSNDARGDLWSLGLGARSLADTANVELCELYGNICGGVICGRMREAVEVSASMNRTGYCGGNGRFGS